MYDEECIHFWAQLLFRTLSSWNDVGFMCNSFDDNVGLLNGLDSWSTTLIYHYNPKRTAVSSFRAIWGWDDQYLFIGNKEKALDAICTSTKITTTLRSPLLTAIPTRVAMHPFSCGTLAGATESGRVYLWRKHWSTSITRLFFCFFD